MNLFKSKYRKPLAAAVLTIAGIMSAVTATAAARMTGSGDVDTGSYTGSGGIKRDYLVYVPQSYDGSTPVPMIMALHGCVMNNQDALNAWNLDVLADQNNVILVLPYVGRFQEMRSDDCWGYWFPKHVEEGKGGEVDDIYQIARKIEGQYNIDVDRRFLTGISSGGAMVVAEAVAHNEYWAAAAPVAGLPYGDGSSSVTADQFSTLSHHVTKLNAELDYDRAVPMLVVQSSNDTTVLPRAMELIRDSQLTVWANDLGVDDTTSCTKGGVSCSLKTYNGADGTPVVRTMLYSGGPGRTATYGKGHYWTGGDDDMTVWSNDSDGPNAVEHMWEFFEEITGTVAGPECGSDTTAPAAPTGLAASDVHDNYAQLNVNANGEADLQGYKIFRTSGAELTPSVARSTTITVSGLNTSTAYSVYAKAVDNCGNESAASASIDFTTTAPEYVAPSVSGTATDHYNSGRLDVNEYIAMGGEHGYVNAFTLWQLESGGWTDTDLNAGNGNNGGNNNDDDGGTTNPTPTPGPVTPGAWTKTANQDGMELHLYTPTSTTLNGKRALMISLHGCAQANEVVRDNWGWTNEADQYGMVVAAPMAPNGGVIASCWDYYGTSHSGSNPSKHDDNLIDLANSLMANASLNIDPDQVYISGLSSGGGEAFVMGCVAPDIFAGIGINAGPALGTSSGQIGSVPSGTTKSSVATRCTGFSKSDSSFETQLTSVVHGKSDYTVGQAYAEVDAGAMAIVYGVNKDSGTNSISGGGTETTWSDSQGKRVSMLMVNGLGHAWPAGSGSGGGYTDHNTVDYPAFVSKFFFENNRRVVIATPTPTPTATPVPTATPAPTATPVPTTTPEPTATPVPTPTATPVPTPTATPVPTPTPVPDNCTDVTAYNYYHKTGGRAKSTGSYWSPAYKANGSGDSMAGSTWGKTTLSSSNGSHWSVGSCP